MADLSDFPVVEGGCRHRLRSHGPYGPTWPCNEPRGHLGSHRFRNYTWPRVPHVWRLKALWATWKCNRRLLNGHRPEMPQPGLMRFQAVLHPKRFDPVPVALGVREDQPEGE